MSKDELSEHRPSLCANAAVGDTGRYVSTTQPAQQSVPVEWKSRHCLGSSPMPVQADPVHDLWGDLLENGPARQPEAARRSSAAGAGDGADAAVPPCCWGL
ncbi:hypothetical protein ACKXF4_08320 [Faecalibacterium prausnitzii]|uniref:hypothetical protein n=1 Tax=Faecalibacterium prausnitzii TaxID=853 RepID=UPI003AAFAAE1